MIAKKDAFVSFVSQYHVNEWAYPDVIHRELNIPLKDVYEALELYVSEGMMAPYLRIYCPKCQRYSGNQYRTVFEIPEYANCVHCDEEIEHPAKYARRVYKVLSKKGENKI